jgi:transposase
MVGKRLTFWEKVQRGAPEECWPWRGYTRASGHGLTSLDSLMIHASRKAWILTYGPIRGEFCVNHKSIQICAQQAICCNPDHMYLGSRADNMVDRWTNTAPDERGSLGRPYVLTHEQMQQLWQMRREGATLKDCAAVFGVHRATIGRYVTAHRKQRIAQLHADRLSAVAKASIS